MDLNSFLYWHEICFFISSDVPWFYISGSRKLYTDNTWNLHRVWVPSLLSVFSSRLHIWLSTPGPDIILFPTLPFPGYPPLDTPSVFQYLLTAMRIWANHFTALSLGFITCQMRIIIGLPHRGVGKSNEIMYVECLIQYQTHMGVQSILDQPNQHKIQPD